ncbi:major royal jelly protein 1-like [Odontomachus brunneus]|uniref:major royal jelly protein 1-like n=1 Tax=Odontomachus brunneus TaxID=486640 RepID=UPI0013F27BB5|nr:major royal jelly protein 1-like [Odontomachus brunneus]
MRALVILLLFAVIVTSYQMSRSEIQPEIIYEWKYIPLKWKSVEQKKEAINAGYVDKRGALYDVDVDVKSGRTFVTSVRDNFSIPVSLMVVDNKPDVLDVNNTSGGPLLAPYPNWDWYPIENTSNISNINCNRNRITNCYRVDIKCNRIYVLDSGIIDDKMWCPPQLLIFDLKTDQLVEKVTIPKKFATNKNGTGLLVTIIVDCLDCKNIDNCVVYMADTEGFGLIVWQKQRGFCRYESNDMRPTDYNFTIADQSFTLGDGILGMASICKNLFYAPLSSLKISKMKKCDLTKPLLCNEINDLTNDQTTMVTELSGQTGPMASKYCALFFSNVPDTSILCKDTGRSNSSNEVMAYNPETLQFISGMKTRCKNLYFLSNRLQRDMTNTRNDNEINYRVLKIDICKIKCNTNCFKSCSDSYVCHCPDDDHRGRPHGGRPHGGRHHGGPPHGGRPHGGPPHGGPPHGGRSHGGPPHDGCYDGDYRGRQHDDDNCYNHPDGHKYWWLG